MQQIYHTALYAKFAVTAVAGIAILASTPALAINNPGWQPQISEKVLVLPQKQLERAIQRDFAASPLASDMLDIDRQIASEVTNIQSLNDSQHLYEGDAAIEAKHQGLAAKRAYIGLMGEQIGLKRSKLETQLRLYKHLTRKARRSASSMEDQREVTAAIDAAQERAGKVESELREDLFYSTNLPESKFGEDYAANRQAIEALRTAIASHPLNQMDAGVDAPANKIEELERLAMNVEAQLAILDMEDEVLGHMAKLLSLDAMAFAEEVAELAYLDNGASADASEDFRSPSSAVELFINF
jgi:hypothetical protein